MNFFLLWANLVLLSAVLRRTLVLMNKFQQKNRAKIGLKNQIFKGSDTLFV